TFFEVLLCSDYPTQLAVAGVLAVTGVHPVTAGGGLSLRYVVSLSLLDTALLVGLVILLIRNRNERVRDVLLGARPVEREIELGVPLTFGALALAIAVVVTLQHFTPSLHNVARNPLQDI